MLSYITRIWTQQWDIKAQFSHSPTSSFLTCLHESRTILGVAEDESAE